MLKKFPYMISNKTYNVRIIRCVCSKCVPRTSGAGSLSWYCDHVGEMFEVDDYQYSPTDFWHIIGMPQKPNDGCWIQKKDTEIVYIDATLPSSLFEV